MSDWEKILEEAATEIDYQPKGGGQSDINSTHKAVLKLEQLMSAIVLVLFIGFAGMFIQSAAMLWNAWQAESSSYQNLQDEVQAQNSKIDTLNRELELQRIRFEMTSATATATQP